MSESNEDLKRRVAELEGQLESEKAKQKKATYLKVSQKGAVSLYGIRRFPVTFYQEEWDRILGMADDVRRFIAEHEAELTRKG
ncbi:MAG: hypothetical protein JRG85_18395 [Deltaproteobacteria bacterium]|nr:hypothetical protein [Deltaproteobacteria bacterium]